MIAVDKNYEKITSCSSCVATSYQNTMGRDVYSPDKFTEIAVGRGNFATTLRLCPRCFDILKDLVNSYE